MFRLLGMFTSKCFGEAFLIDRTTGVLNFYSKQLFPETDRSFLSV